MTEKRLATWQLLGDEVVYLLILAVYTMAGLSYGLVQDGAQQSIAFALCGLIGIWGVTGLLQHRFGKRETTLFLSFSLLLMTPALVGLLQLIPLSGNLVEQLLPLQLVSIDGVEGAALSIDGRFPISLNAEEGWQAFNQWLAALGFFAGCAVLCTRRRFAIRFLYTIAVLTLIEALSGLYDLYGGGAFRSSGLIYNPNHHAAFLLSGFPLLIAALLNLQRSHPGLGSPLWSGRNPLILGYLLLALAMIAWVGAFSRLSLIVGIVLLPTWYFWEVLPRPHGHKAFWQAPALGLLAMILIGGFITIIRPDALQDRVDGDALAASTNRLALWDAGWRAFTKQPIVGLGPGGSEAAINRFAEVPLPREPIHMHNDWLQLLCELGIIGSLLVMAAALLFLTGIVAQVRGHRLLAGRSALVRRAALLSLVTLALHSIVDFPLRVPIISLQGMMICALLFSTGSRRATESPPETMEKG